VRLELAIFLEQHNIANLQSLGSRWKHVQDVTVVNRWKHAPPSRLKAKSIPARNQFARQLRERIGLAPLLNH